VTGLLTGLRVREGVEEDDDGEGVLGLGVVLGVVLPFGVLPLGVLLLVPPVGFVLVVVVGVAAGEVLRLGVLGFVLGFGFGFGPELGLDEAGLLAGVVLGVVVGRFGVPVGLGPVTGLPAGLGVRVGTDDDDGEGAPALDTFGPATGELPAEVEVGVLAAAGVDRGVVAGPALSRLGLEGMPEAGDWDGWLVGPGSALWWLGV
jgi:hypothetical protein